MSGGAQRAARGGGRGRAVRDGRGGHAPRDGSREPIQLPRQVAFEVLRAVTDSDAYANLLLPRELERARLRGPDAGLATELTYGTLRARGTYDAIIREAAGRDLDRIDPPVLDALRLGAHQLLATRVAPHAAVNESVALARREAGFAAAGFANAVLRRVSERTAEEWTARLAETARSDDERLALRTAHPVWIIRALRRALAAEGRGGELDALLDADNAAPTVTMAALPGLAEPEGERTAFSPVGFRLPGGDPEPVIRGSEGRRRVQDEGSQLVALALARLRPAEPGERWLDLCAGPGGKTALLAAEALAAEARLEANEIVPARAGLVRRAIAPVPLDVEVHQQDGRELAAAHPASYDRILVDAPCTGLGALRRRPEARWRKHPQDVGELVPLQTALLNAAVDALAPGGVVAYVTCSPHLAETAGVVREVLDHRAHEIEELDARAALQQVSLAPLDLPAQSDGSGRAQLWPHRHGTDAMSLSLLRKRG